jgi:hypothetical protein
MVLNLQDGIDFRESYSNLHSQKNFENHFLDIVKIIPETIEIQNYDVFQEIENSYNATIPKTGRYLYPLCDLDIHKLYFHLIKNACDNKKMVIKNPLNDKTIESDIYFITHLTSDVDNSFIFNYYFHEENIVFGLYSGGEVVGLSTQAPAYLIYLNERKYFGFNGLSNNWLHFSEYYLPIVVERAMNIDVEKINLEKPLITTFEGYTLGLFHACCSFVNGIYIMDQIGLKNDIDQIIMGLNDPFLMEKYYRNKYPNINVIRGGERNNFDTHKIYKGVIFKYCHFHLINKGVEFIKSYIECVMPAKKECKDEVEYIKKNFYPIFSVNLRCLMCEIKNQGIVMAETINKLKTIYPNAFFLIGGFLGDYNEDLMNDQNMQIASFCGTYKEILDAYNMTFEIIKNSLNHSHIKSLLNLKINNVLKFVEIVNFSINMNAGYTTVETILNDIPSTYFGTRWNEHNRKTWYMSKENYKEPIFIEDPNKINFITDHIYAPITCEISSETIVDIVLEYDKTNNNFFDRCK